MSHSKGKKKKIKKISSEWITQTKIFLYKNHLQRHAFFYYDTKSKDITPSGVTRAIRNKELCNLCQTISPIQI